MVRLTQPLLSRSATQSGDEEEESEQQLCMVDKPASAVDTTQTMITCKKRRSSVLRPGCQVWFHYPISPFQPSYEPTRHVCTYISHEMMPQANLIDCV